MKKLIKILKDPKIVITYMAVTFALVVHYIYTNWKVVPDILASCNLTFLLYAFIFSCLNLMSYGYVVYILYRELGAEISYSKTLQIIVVSRIGIYVPGRIWYASNFYIFSRKLNISPLIITQSFGLTNIFLFITGGVCSLPVVLPMLSYWGKVFFTTIICMIFVVSHPNFLKHIVSLFPKLKKIVENRLYFTRFNSGVYLKFIIYFFVLWIIAGITLFFCVLALAPVQYNDFMTILAASATSLILGMLAIFAPGGIGIREGVGVFVLSTIISVESALFVMIISRMLSAITDLGSGIFGFYLLNRSDNEEQEVQQTK